MRRRAEQPSHTSEENVVHLPFGIDRFSRLPAEPRPLPSGGIRMLSLLPNLEPCEPRGRNGDEQLAAMVLLLRIRRVKRC